MATPSNWTPIGRLASAHCVMFQLENQLQRFCCLFFGWLKCYFMADLYKCFFLPKTYQILRLSIHLNMITHIWIYLYIFTSAYKCFNTATAEKAAPFDHQLSSDWGHRLVHSTFDNWLDQLCAHSAGCRAKEYLHSMLGLEWTYLDLRLSRLLETSWIIYIYGRELAILF